MNLPHVLPRRLIYALREGGVVEERVVGLGVTCCLPISPGFTRGFTVNVIPLNVHIELLVLQESSWFLWQAKIRWKKWTHVSVAWPAMPTDRSRVPVARANKPRDDEPLSSAETAQDLKKKTR